MGHRFEGSGAPLRPRAQKCPTSRRNRAPLRSKLRPTSRRNQCPISSGIRTFGPREESIDGGREETDGETSGGRTCHQTCVEGSEEAVIQVVRRRYFPAHV